MNQFLECVDRIDRLRFPGDLSFRRDGQCLCVSVRPATREVGQGFQGRIWRIFLDGKSEQLTHGPGNDALCRYAPTDDRLAFASDRAVSGKMAPYILDEQGPHPVGDIPGTVEDLRWTPDGRSLIVHAADRGLDGGATNAATRLWWGEPDDPSITRPSPRRRLFRIDLWDGSTSELGPADVSIWEFDLLGSDGAVAIVSGDASERGWYHARLVRLDFAKMTAQTLHETAWQMIAPAVSPNGKHVAFLEGWSSDRGLVASTISLLDLESRRITTLDAPVARDVTTMVWRDDQSLWFAGWSKIGVVYGLIGADGNVTWSRYEDAIVGANSFSASIAPGPDKQGFAAVREAVGVPPEVAFKTDASSDWRTVSALNDAVASGFAGYPEVRPVAWKGAGGLSLEGLLLLPRGRPDGPLPTIVDIHGGPSWAAKHAFNPGYAVPYAAAGYAVFLPNYRGNTGWGQDFARLNIGDPGGAEFEDILAGIEVCVAEGYADAERLGVTGASYGGYMTAWAVATTARFKAAVMVSGISNQLSSHYSCNHDFHGFINGGPLTEAANRATALDRSPIMRLDRPRTPTLIIHGADDRCTPLGQAQEFYGALLERNCAAELIVYPREGHGLREREHRRDAWARTIAWFDRYLGHPVR
jgi:dipeptidyl aminopeptidase/acylaminoacyl peptidase